jgi:nucleoside 2-deoxyribosyltransferase
MEATFKTLDSDVLVRDLLDHGLRAGDMGAVVEVGFVAASGKTRALLTLNASDRRSSRD